MRPIHKLIPAVAIALLVSIIPATPASSSLIALAGHSRALPQTVNLVLGNPSEATEDPDNKDNFMMVKPQFVLSFNNSKGGANWVAWHLQSSDIGNVSRGDFHVDTSLPEGFKRITKQDYNNSGYDRGHLCNSKDRTKNKTNNDATFNMTNILPQAADNNQGPWVRLEDFSRQLASEGNELYIYAGAFGTGGTGKNGLKRTIAAGEVNVPRTFWKIMIILPRGNNDLSRIDANTRAIAVCMPNKQGIRNVSWQKFVTTIRNVEAATGYDFLTTLSSSVQQAIESRKDSAGTSTGNPCQ